MNKKKTIKSKDNDNKSEIINYKDKNTLPQIEKNKFNQRIIKQIW